MALQAAYTQFLAAPTSAALAADASLHYITTIASHAGATDIIKHLASLRNQIKKKKQDFISVVEGRNAIAAEIDTVLEFVTSGGPYLPGLDDNFLADRTVALSITHVVAFDAAGKISQIRQTWDQGALLKQLDIIGKTGRNWPIRDSKDQIGLLARCAAKANNNAPSSAADQVSARGRGNSTNIMRDPHASLALFGSREEMEIPPPAVVSPYAGHRPPQRNLNEILGDEPADEAASPSNGRGRSHSPHKSFAPKTGAGKNFQPIRLFEADEDDCAGAGGSTSPDRGRMQPMLRPHAKKYEHFDFADGTEPQDAPKGGVDMDKALKTRHDSQWSFDDFVTPQKPRATRGLAPQRINEVRHWGISGQEDGNVQREDPTVGDARRSQPAKPRRDDEWHFEFVDDGMPPAQPRPAGRPRGDTQNKALGLYDNNLYKENGEPPSPGPAPLGNITNVKDRRKDFDPHFVIADVSPSSGEGGAAPAKVGEDRKKAVRMMESSWDPYDESPVARKENTNPSGGIHIAGDGMGSRKATANGGQEKKQVIHTTGDGMGGKKGSGRAWGIGDDSDEEVHTRPVPGKKQHRSEAHQSFWDFE